MQGKEICCMKVYTVYTGIGRVDCLRKCDQKSDLDPCHAWIAETLLLYNDVLLLYFSYECNRPEYGSQHVFQVWLVELLHVDISSVPEMFTIVMLASINAQLRATVWKE